MGTPTPTEPLDPGPKLPQEMAEFSATLNTGAKMPRVGLGTWKAPPEKTKEAVMTAVKAGYRMLDCANDYDNEHVIGEALKELFAAGVVKREELFIQAKLWNSNHRPEHVRPDIMKTLEDLQLDYIDSFVIHWPQAVPSNAQLTLRPNGCFPAHKSKNSMFPLDDEGYYCVTWTRTTWRPGRPWRRWSRRVSPSPSG